MRLLKSIGIAALSAGALVQPVGAQTSVPIEIVNNHVFVRMTARSQDLWLLLDTGAGLTLLHRPVAESLRFAFGDPVGIGGAGPGRAQGVRLKDARLQLPEDPSIAVSPAIAMPMTVLNALEGRAVDGILGADFIGQKVLEIDYEGRRLVLHDSKTFAYRGTGSRLPMTMKDGKPHVRGTVLLSDGTGIDADCHVDAGASAALILTKPFVEKHHLLERVGPTIRRRGGSGAGGSAWANHGRVAGLRLGASTLITPITAFYGDSAGVFSTNDFDCNVGGEILRRFRVIFDYGRKVMILEPNASLGAPFEADMGGAAFRIDREGLSVGDVMPGGPSEKAGLVEGDRVIAIDGRPAKEYGLDSLRRRLRQPGGEVVFTVRREGRDVEIRLPVRRIIP